MNQPQTPPRFTAIIESIPDTIPFVAPEQLEREQGRKFAARLGANESAFGISKLAEAALHDAIGIEGCSWYGDPLSFELREMLSSQYNIAMDTLCVDAGIDSLLGLTVRLFLEPGAVMVTSRGAYPTVNYHVSGCGGRVHAVPYIDNHEDTRALAEAAHEHGARLVYLANPDNPMGTRVSAESIQVLIDSLPPHCVLLLDEAYIEFMPQEAALKIDTAQANVIRFRTFSKAYGMAGLRIGYAIANPRLIRAYDKIRNHFGVNRLAQIAALASLRDTNMLPNVVQAVETGRQRIYTMANDMNLSYLPSSTNFVAVDLGNSDRATGILQQLAKRGIFMRKPMQAPLDRFLRVGVGTLEEHELLLSVLPGLIGKVDKYQKPNQHADT